MNAHAPKRFRNAREIASPPSFEAVCPAETIGLRLQEIDEWTDKHDLEGHLPSVELQIRELGDEADALVRQLEFVTARNLRGLYVQVQQLGALVDELQDLGRSRDSELDRRARRLTQRIGDALIVFGRVEIHELGRAHRWLNRIADPE
jgi:hypothetical protein